MILVRADHRPEWICRMECALDDYAHDGDEARLRATLERLGFDAHEIEELLRDAP